MYAFLESTFPTGNNSRYFVYGGYNLNRILLHGRMLQDPSCRFNFSGLTALLLPAEECPRIRHRNRYREIMINREIRRDLLGALKEKQPEYLFMDLVEERFDTALIGGRYVTLSDAYMGSEGYSTPEHVIPFDSDERFELWRQSFAELVGFIRENSPGTKIIVVENYLSTEIGDLQDRKPFENFAEIEHVNGILGEYYRHIKEEYQNIKTIEVKDLPEYFTDKAYEYGAQPPHLNEIVNQKIMRRIEKLL